MFWLLFWAQAAAQIHFSPSRLELAQGAEFSLELRVHTQSSRVVVLEGLLQHDPGLSFLGHQESGDFSIFVQPALSYDLPGARLHWVEGQPNPGHGGSGIRSLLLRFKALESGTHYVRLLRLGQAEEDTHLFLLGIPPKDGLEAQASAQILVRTSPAAKRWVVPAPLQEGMTSQLFLACGAQGTTVLAKRMDSQGQAVGELAPVTLAPWQVAEVPLAALGLGEWLSIENAELIGGYVFHTSPDGQRMSAWELSEESSELFVPHIAADRNQFATRAVVAGHPVAGIAPDCHFLAGETTTALGGGARLTLDFQALFPAQLPSWGLVCALDYSTTRAGVEFFERTGSHLPQQVALPLDGETSLELLFPHLARNLSVFWTGLVLNNISRLPNRIQLTAYNDQGQVNTLPPISLAPQQKLTILLQADAQGQAQTVTQPPLNLSLPAGVDWVRAQAERPISGYVLFGDRDNRFLAGFQSAKRASSSLVFPQVYRGENRFTGYALLNSSTASLSCELLLLAANGTPQRTLSLDLPAASRRVALDTAFFDGLPLEAGIHSILVRQKSGEPALAGFLLTGDLSRNQLAGQLALAP